MKRKTQDSQRSQRAGNRSSAGGKSSSAAAQARPMMNIASILVPVDFSPSSMAALAYATSFAQQFEARVTVLHIVEPAATHDFDKSSPMVMEDDKAVGLVKAQLQRIAEAQSADSAVSIRTLVRTGRSWDEITKAARSLKADLIVISTHGRTGLKHMLLGSTAERVVRHSPCPVLILRRDDA